MAAMLPTEFLPEPLPREPLSLAAAWLAEATRRADQPNPNAMVLATASGDGQPSARVVLCKEIIPAPGFVCFYTNYRSRKGRELESNPRAALVMHWDHLHRQVRIDGRRCKPFDRVLTGQKVRIPPVNVERKDQPAQYPVKQSRS